jgi:hypothetical protein
MSITDDTSIRKIVEGAEARDTTNDTTTTKTIEGAKPRIKREHDIRFP